MSATTTQLAPHAEPYQLFKEWFAEAEAHAGLKEPNYMALATADEQGRPSCRIILMKHYDERGFCFYTNLTSRKGRELKVNQSVALTFYWEAIGKQVRIEGQVERVTDKEADDYFATRQRGSQIGAWASKQSSVMATESEFETRVRDITEQFQGQPIARPPFWSGFRVLPARIEFWKAGEFRLHTRIVYEQSSETPAGAAWQVTRRYP